MGNIIGLLEKEFPVSILTNKNEGVKTRDRVFTVNNTLLTMVLISVQQDKTLKNSVDLYVHYPPEAQGSSVSSWNNVLRPRKKKTVNFRLKSRGRPKNTMYNCQRAQKDISLNTAAYSMEARERVPIERANDLLKSHRTSRE